jgi:hypothetical protein
MAGDEPDGLDVDKPPTRVEREQTIPRPERGIRIRRLRLLGAARSYEVDFRTDGSARNGCNIIAGPTNTGKTSVLRFIAYGLGGSNYPAYPEVLRQVRSVALEFQTSDGIFTVERSLDGSRALMYPTALDRLDTIEATTYVIEPTSHPNSLSQFMLSTVGLQDVSLKEAPTQQESSTDRLSFRDVMWVCLYLNERIGSQQLLNSGNTQKAIKLRQVVDAIFEVHDNEDADLARRIKDAQTTLDHQRRSVELLQEFVSKQEPKSITRLEIEANETDDQLQTVQKQLAELDQRETAASAFASDLRAYMASVASKAAQSAARVRDRLSMIDRFASLRAQYADDVRKLTLLVEAESVFNQLSVEVCPACMNPLLVTPIVDNGVCSLCNQSVTSTGELRDDAVERAQRELRSAKRRFKELDEYWHRLSRELGELENQSQQDAQLETEVSARLDQATRAAVTPFLGERNELQIRRQRALVQKNEIANGLKLQKGLDARLTDLARAEKNLEALRRQQREKTQRPDRSAIIAQLSERFRNILYEIRYPKVDETGVLPPYIDVNLVPFVRGQHFREASSGGQVLVSLAWALAIFEIAYETNSAHPGFLMIDTPQKNLGGAAADTEFADIRLIERFYGHVDEWLSEAGAGAQIIIVDNTPPTMAAKHVVVRYTRDPRLPPFGLIDNEVGRDEDQDVAGSDLGEEQDVIDAGGREHAAPPPD